jgi:preprotein translocase subunit SecY
MARIDLSSLGSKIKSFVTAPFKRAGKVIAKVTPKSVKRVTNNSIIAALKTKEVQKKIGFTLLVILVFRIMAAVPLPGIDFKLFNQVFGNNPLNNIFTIITGGRLDNPSIVAIGLGAYINASVILQLLQTVIPKLEDLSKEGERGRKVINSYTRLLAVPLNIVQAFVIYTILKNVANTVPSLSGIVANIRPIDVITMIAALTAGSMVLMWLGELITENGIGNGTSIIITVGILSVVPGLMVRDFNFLQGDFKLLLNGNFNVLLDQSFILLYLTIGGLLLLIYGITFITSSTRKLTIQYASRVRAVQSGQSSYLPLKINQAGVMPVIFASALLTFPQIIAQLLTSLSDKASFLYKIGDHINNSFLGSAYRTGKTEEILMYEFCFFLLIIFFTYFYTLVTFKPSETADNLKKSGGFIPGIRPGKETEKHILSILLRLTFWGSLFLGIVALIPSLLRLLPQGTNLTIFSGIGGTSLLIVVGVITDTIRQIKSVAVTRSYDQFK